jgi:CRP-like cAMP-binding protein
MIVVVCLIGNDIRPYTELEVVFATSLLLLGVMIIALFIGSLTSIVADADYLANKKKEQIQSVMSYMKYRQVPRPLQSKIVSYLNYLWTSAQSTYHQNLVGDLPDTLALQLNLVLKRRLIECVPMFAMISPHAMIGIVHRLESIIALPNQILTHQGDTGDCMYFITRGLLSVIANGRSTIELSAGDFFGESAMLNDDDLRPSTVVSKTFSELEMLVKEDFLDLSEEHEEIRGLMEVHSKERAEKAQRRLQGNILMALQLKRVAKIAKLKVQERHAADAEAHAPPKREAPTKSYFTENFTSVGVILKMKRRGKRAKAAVATRQENISNATASDENPRKVQADAEPRIELAGLPPIKPRPSESKEMEHELPGIVLNKSPTSCAADGKTAKPSSWKKMKRRLSQGASDNDAFMRAMEASTGTFVRQQSSIARQQSPIVDSTPASLKRAGSAINFEQQAATSPRHRALNRRQSYSQMQLSGLERASSMEFLEEQNRKGGNGS